MLLVLQFGSWIKLRENSECVIVYTQPHSELASDISSGH